MGPLIAAWEKRTADAFKAKNPNATVNLVGVPWGDYNAKLLAMFAAGTIPEVFGNWAAGFGTFLINGALQDVSSYVSQEKLDLSKTFEPSAVAALTRDGKLMGMPDGDEPTILYYNKDLFDKAGVKPPSSDWSDKEWTTEAMATAAQKMSHDQTDPRKGEWGMIFDGQQLGVTSWLWGVDPYNNQGGPQKTEAYQTGKVTEAFYDAPKFATAMQWVADLSLKQKVSPHPSDVNALSQGVGTPFLTGRIGMWVSGQFSMSNVKNANPKWKWGIAALPYGPAGLNTSPLFNDSFFLGKGAKQIDEGWQFLKFLTMDTPAEDYSQSTAFWPTRVDLWDKSAAAYAKIPGATQSADEIKKVITGAFAQGFVTPGKTLDRYVELNNAWTQTSATIWTGQTPVPDGLKQVQAKISSIVSAK